MIRRLAALLTGGALLGACAQSKPADVSPDFTDTVTTLLKSVDPTTSPVYEAATCGALTDPNPDAKIAMWADARVTGVTPEALREAGIAAGWQPVKSTHDIVLIGPDGRTRLALDGTKVRAEWADCSIAGKHQELNFHPVVPDLTPAQVRTLTPAFDATATAVRGIHDLLGAPADPKVYPPSGALDEAPAVRLAICPGGATWSARTEGQLTTKGDQLKPDVVSYLDTQAWTVDPRPNQPLYLQATKNDVTLRINLAPTFTIDANYAGCAKVTN